MMLHSDIIHLLYQNNVLKNPLFLLLKKNLIFRKDPEWFFCGTCVSSNLCVEGLGVGGHGLGDMFHTSLSVCEIRTKGRNDR